jgi:tetratricopeptide (TPR) repeat protein
LELGGEKNLEMCHDTLKTRHFHVWEGGYGIHHAWMETNQQLGDMAYARKNYTQALAYYQQAGEYPKNLEVAPRTPDFRAHVYWSLAKGYLALEQTSKANEYLHMILNERYRKPQMGTYFQALAQKALKNDAAAGILLASLEKTAREYTSGKFEYRGGQTVIGHYLLSLVLEERGDKVAAQVERRKALDLDPQAGRLALTQAQIEYAGAHQ